MRLDQETIQEIRALFGAELDARNRIDAETHAADHAWTRMKREQEALRASRREKVLEHVMGWGAVAIIVSVLSAVGWVISSLGAVVLASFRTWIQQGAQH